MKSLACVLILFLLSGCSSGMMTIPSSEVIDSAGNIVTKTSSTIGDASTYRTNQKYLAWRAAYREYSKAYETSGFSMSYMEKKLSDGTSIMLPLIAFKQPPQFVPPDDLKDHPVWGTINNVVNKVTPWAFGSWAAVSLASSFEEIAKVPTNAFYGDANLQGSLNNASGDQFITTDQQRIDSPDNINEETGLDAGGDFLGIPGCSSEESYLAGNCIELPEATP